MSPGRYAPPPTEFSVAATTASVRSGSPSSAIDADALDDGAASGHVSLHVLHVERRLDRDAARVERDRLADEAEHDVALRRGRLVAEDDHARRVVAALGDAGEGAHPELRELVGAERLGGQVRVLGRASSSARSASRSGVSSFAPRVREVTRAVRRLGDRRGALRLLPGVVVAADEHEPLEGMLGLRPGLPAPGVVRAEQQPVDDGARLLGVGERVVEEPRERSPDPLARLGDRGRCGPDGVGVQLVRRPEADERRSAGPVRSRSGTAPPSARPWRRSPLPRLRAWRRRPARARATPCGPTGNARTSASGIESETSTRIRGRDAIRQGFYGGSRRLFTWKSKAFHNFQTVLTFPSGSRYTLCA